MDGIVDVADRLHQVDLFAHFAPAQLALLAECATVSRFPKGATIVKEGDSTAEAYVILKGRVRIRRETPYGEYELATLNGGELFGETAFIDRNARSGDAVTEAATDLVVLNPLALAAATERDQRFTIALYWAFWKSLSRKLRATNQRLAHFFSQSPHRPPAAPQRAASEEEGEFRVGMAAKRSLFQEQTLSPMEINFLATLSQEKKLEPGEMIFREGDPGDAMYIVLEGRVMISKFITGAGEEALAFLERGDYFGEMALIDNDVRSADAKADEGGAVVLRMPREIIEGILDINKVSSLRLLRLLCALVAKRLREVDDKIIGWHILAAGGGTLPSAEA